MLALTKKKDNYVFVLVIMYQVAGIKQYGLVDKKHLLTHTKAEGSLVVTRALTWAYYKVLSVAFAAERDLSSTHY